MTETVSFTAAIFVAAGFLQGFAGFGAGLLAVPLLLLRFDITVAVPVCVLASIVLNAQLCVSYRDALSWRNSTQNKGRLQRTQFQNDFSKAVALLGLPWWSSAFQCRPKSPGLGSASSKGRGLFWL